MFNGNVERRRCKLYIYKLILYDAVAGWSQLQVVVVGWGVEEKERGNSLMINDWRTTENGQLWKRRTNWKGFTGGVTQWQREEGALDGKSLRGRRLEISKCQLCFVFSKWRMTCRWNCKVDFVDVVCGQNGTNVEEGGRQSTTWNTTMYIYYVLNWKGEGIKWKQMNSKWNRMGLRCVEKRRKVITETRFNSVVQFLWFSDIIEYI